MPINHSYDATPLVGTLGSGRQFLGPFSGYGSSFGYHFLQASTPALTLGFTPILLSNFADAMFDVCSEEIVAMIPAISAGSDRKLQCLRVNPLEILR